MVVRLIPARSASPSCDRPRWRRSCRSRWPSRTVVHGWVAILFPLARTGASGIPGRLGWLLTGSERRPCALPAGIARLGPEAVNNLLILGITVLSRNVRRTGIGNGCAVSPGVSPGAEKRRADLRPRSCCRCSFLRVGARRGVVRSCWCIHLLCGCRDPDRFVQITRNLCKLTVIGVGQHWRTLRQCADEPSGPQLRRTHGLPRARSVRCRPTAAPALPGGR